MRVERKREELYHMIETIRNHLPEERKRFQILPDLTKDDLEREEGEERQDTGWNIQRRA
tara:strand:+ start:834 stop:1010 length:177 start_codon:yes stop_codon:yes gene_type:complete